MSILFIRFAAGGFEDSQRSPLLERLIARASGPARGANWRAEAFGVIAPDRRLMPPIAATALYAASAAVVGTWVCVATAVHLMAGMSGVTMPPNGILELDPAEAATLAADFNRVFADAGMRLAVCQSATLLCVFDGETLDVTTHDPEEAAGRDVFAYQPSGGDAPRLRRLMSEMEMWLFDHDVNRARVTQARPPITGLWLWGGGEPMATLPQVRGWTAGRDPFFSAFGSEQRFVPESGDGVVVCTVRPASSDWPDVERRWLAPAAAALRSGRIERLDLSAADRRFSVGRMHNLRFWRRPRPWWESFAQEGDGSYGRQ